MVVDSTLLPLFVESSEGVSTALAWGDAVSSLTSLCSKNRTWVTQGGKILLGKLLEQNNHLSGSV